MYRQITDNVRYLKGVGPSRAKILEKLGVKTIEDLLYYFPRRYEDRTQLTEIAKLQVGKFQTVKGRVLCSGQRLSFHKKSLKIFETAVEDKTGKFRCVWFNQPYLRNYLKDDKEAVLYGKVEFYDKHLQMQNPEFEIIDDAEEKDSLNYGRITPIYSLTEKLSQRVLRRIIKTCLDEYLPVLSDIVPHDVRMHHNLLNIAGTMLNMHFPQDALRQEAAYKRIVFEECFLMQLMFGLKRLKMDRISGIAHKFEEGLLKSFQESLPFELTAAQKRVMEEIRSDMTRSQPMHRLLQGDVGSGKTVVALYACLLAASSSHQAAFMVPTEILAEQHYANIRNLLLKFRQINAALLTSSLTKKEKEKIYAGIRGGKAHIVIGTHALIQAGLDFKSLGLVVIDEQHKFGVHQRLDILTKGLNPDCLIMTATPIPRTLAMTVYSDLDISTLDELPKGRLPVKTYLAGEEKRRWVYDFIRENLKKGRQCYIVYPIIDDSEKLDLKAAATMYEDLRKNVFSDFKVALVHGRLKQDERVAIMRAFQKGKINILVSTVVIEVGVDVANASVMVIEHAERFGLAQLHQLRGRIGRGSYESHCILVAEHSTEEADSRLQAILEENDGFKIAEKDLEIRGPGEFFGVRQHGLPELRINPIGNIGAINTAREEARGVLEKDPGLKARQNSGLAKTLKKRFPDYEKFAAS